MTRKLVLSEFLGDCANVISDQCDVDLATASRFVEDFQWIFSNMSSNTQNPVIATLYSGVTIYGYILAGQADRIRSHRDCKVPATIAGRLNSAVAGLCGTPNNKAVAMARENRARARAAQRPYNTTAA